MQNNLTKDSQQVDYRFFLTQYRFVDKYMLA